jgi:hypothetical protein
MKRETGKELLCGKRDIRVLLLTYTCNPNYLGGRDQEDHGLRSAQAKKVHEAHISTSCWTWWHVTHSQLQREAKIGGSWFQTSSSIKGNLISKITNTERTRRMAQVGATLPRMCETLSSTPSITNEKRVLSGAGAVAW